MIFSLFLPSLKVVKSSMMIMLLLLKLICPLSKAELTTLFGKFKEQLDKKSPVIILKDEPEARRKLCYNSRGAKASMGKRFTGSVKLHAK